MGRLTSFEPKRYEPRRHVQEPPGGLSFAQEPRTRKDLLPRRQDSGRRPLRYHHLEQATRVLPYTTHP
jgi:hypothetical protein